MAVIPTILFLCFKTFLKIQDLGGLENTVSATPHGSMKL